MRYLIPCVMILSLSLFSCTNKSSEEPREKNAVSGYVDTLSKAPQKARDAAGAARGSNDEKEKVMKDLEK